MAVNPKQVIERFESTEAASLPQQHISPPTLTAVGSVAAKALESPLLKEHFAERCLERKSLGPCASVEELSGREDWSLALILSPYKQTVGAMCDFLTPSAEKTGVVDTLLRGGDSRLYGVNTNVFGAMHAIGFLLGGAEPERCLILGTGATSRSCVVALRDLFEAPQIGVKGRNLEGTFSFASSFSLMVVDDIKHYEPDLIINATTVGETTDATLDYPVEDALKMGTRFFDLNNRTSGLQTTALSRGCVTISGIIMQRLVNTLRAYLASPQAPQDHPFQ